MAAVRPQPLLAVADVEASSRWYEAVLGATGSHGGPEYQQLRVDGELVLQLHLAGEDHHHATIGDPSAPMGNGVAVWFEVERFDAAVQRSRALGASLVTDVHVNPNSGHRELWLRDLDGYLVVLSSVD